MARPVLDDGLWTLMEPLIPRKKRRRKNPGRLPIQARLCLEGIIFVLKTGIPWEDLPAQFGCCGMTCWRRLRDWNLAGVWDAIHRLLLARLHGADQIDWSRAVIDSGNLRAVGGAS